MNAIILMCAALYVVVGAAFLGMYSAEDYYRGLTPTPKIVALNLLLAVCWPVLLLMR